MADGTSFMVDLAALSDAIGQVSGERETISGGISSLRTTFSNVEDHWRSPAGTSFGALVTNFNAVTETLMSLLDESISKMQAAHENYASTEETNTSNYQSKAVGPGDGGTSSQGDPGSQGDTGTQRLAQPEARQAPQLATNARPTERIA